MKDRKQPTLRFPEFSGEWKVNRLECLFEEFKSGNGITADRITTNDEFPVYGGNGLRGYTDKYTHEGKYFLIGRQGALCGNINRFEGKAFISEHAIACRANIDSDTEWLAQRLDYYNLNRLSESSAQPGLSVKKLLRFKLIVPNLQEQQKIAAFLIWVDRKIEKLEKKGELLGRYKKGVMQKIFSQEMRFRGDDGKEYPEWEEKRIGEILTIGSGKDYKHLEEGSIPVYGTGGYMTSVNDFLYDGKTVCIGRKGTIDKPLYHEGKLWTVDTLFYTHKFKKCIPEYVYIVFQNINWKLYNEASGVPSLSKATIEKIKMNLPCLEEQEKIANFLSVIDKKIEVVEQETEKMKEFKKGLLQQMFV